MEINSLQLQLLIMAVRDAIRLAKEKLERLPEDQIEDQEDYLAQLGNLQADLKAEYESRQAKGEKLTPYDFVVGNKKFRKL
jgi:hypothetical protein